MIQFTPHLAGVHPPTPLDLDKEHKVDNWKLWKQQWNNYMTLSNLKSLGDTFQFAMLENCLGSSALKMYNQLSFPGRKSVSKALELMELCIVGELNETYERYCLNSRSQQPDESVDDFITDLRNLAKTCGFCDCMNDSLIRDRIVMGIRGKDTRKKLLSMKKLSLTNSIDICKAHEATTRRLQQMSTSTSTSSEVHKVNRHQPKKSQSYKPSSSTPATGAYARSPVTRECKFCDTTHPMLKSKCPAYGKKCSKCGQMNHYAVRCPRNRKKIHQIAEDSEDSDDSELKLLEAYCVNSVSLGKGNQIYAELHVCDKPVKLQIDCGATVNILPKSLIGNLKMSPTSTLLQMWNRAIVKPLGEAKVPITNPVTGDNYLCKFVIVSDNHGFVPLLGNKVSQKMGLITVNSDLFKRVASISSEPVDPVRTFPDVFNEDLGQLPGPATLTVDPNITPEIAPNRRVPEALMEPLAKELDKLCRMQVIVPVDKPTDWVSNILVARKKSGDLRVCINPQALNKALKRERYQLPVLEDLLPKLSKAKVFTTMDLKAGYWHVPLDSESSHLTTFSTPAGRYRFLRLPFGCNVSSEIFQKKLFEAIGDLPGVLCVADDIMLYGVGSTEIDALVDHDKKLLALLQRCQEIGIRLNKDKVSLRQKSVCFLGHLVTAGGLKPDPEKVRAIADMPPPTDLAGVQRVNGFTNYLAKFLPQLSDVMEPIRQLTRKDVPWNWSNPQQTAFEKMQHLVKNAPCLKYFDSSVPLVVQCDASEKGLGAALLQNGQPICYASRALTDVETRYAQIEKEMLAIVFSLERFHQYTFARHVTVHSDHKPLESILKKPLYKAPRRLQGMLMRLQRYEVHVIYKPGKLMYLADTLSRAFPAPNGDPSPQEDLEQINMVKYLPISDHRLTEIRESTARDESLQLLKDVILNGWPEDRSSLPIQVHPYFPYRDELTVQDGLIFRGERVVIPKDLRQSAKERAHSSHLGIEGCLRRARECLFWPNMNADLKDYIEKCEVCSNFQNSNQKETLMNHEVPDRPWSKVGTDLFSIGDANYLITKLLDDQSYEISTQDNTHRRNRVHLNATKEPPPVPSAPVTLSGTKGSPRSKVPSPRFRASAVATPVIPQSPLSTPKKSLIPASSQASPLVSGSQQPSHSPPSPMVCSKPQSTPVTTTVSRSGRTIVPPARYRD